MNNRALLATVKPLPVDPELILSSNVSYALVHRVENEASVIPWQVGSGKFAKVYRAMQRSTGRDLKPVAIKILHDYADLHAERLFRQEVDLLKDLSTTAGVNVVRALDVIRLGPTIMCACGKLYRPRCPRGCDDFLQRKPPQPTDVYPILGCSHCDYELSAQHVQRAGAVSDLLRPPAKRCCNAQPTATAGTVVNFVDREAVVMELLETRLETFVERRRKHVIKAVEQLAERRVGSPRAEGDLIEEVVLLEKVFLMVQLAEAVAWLHGDKRIVHKDLAPDNIMVNTLNEGVIGEGWRGESANSKDLLEGLASYPTFSLRVIDFGLADKEDLSRSWYEDISQLINIKLPYLSPEAKLRKLPLGAHMVAQLDFDTTQRRFRVPPDLLSSRLSLLPGDVLADVHDSRHDHDMKIEQLREEGGATYAYYQGEPPPTLSNRQLELVRELGEAHDIYAVGAIFYFILTGIHEQVDALVTIVDSLQEEPLGLELSLLRKRGDYLRRRAKLPEQLFQDDLLFLILRAMVRGKPQSFAQNRIERGPAPAQRLLHQTRQVYQRLQSRILGQSGGLPRLLTFLKRL